MPEIVWQPNDELRTESNVARFMAEHDFATFDSLLARSIDDAEWFWDAVVRFLELPFVKPYEQVLDTSDGIAFSRWFEGSTLNIATACVDRWANDPEVADQDAIVWEGEAGETRVLCYRALQAMTDRIAHGLAARGIGSGDAVGVFLPMLPETVAAVFAIAKLGAIFLPIFSGYAADAVAVRLAGADAKALFVADGFTRRAKVVATKEIADAAVARVPSVETVVVINRLGRDVPMVEGRDVRLEELTLGHDAPFTALAVPAEHPLFVAYTSGTTGLPKGSVHVHGGFLVKIAEEAAFQTDVRRGERLFWLTDIGWIMGPWAIVGTLANGGTLVLFDGAPDYPAPDRLWAFVERHRINILGVSPTLIRALLAHGDDAVTMHDRSSLRILASTGEPWNEDPWRWLFEVVGERRCPIINISGGTEVGACFLSPHVVQPLSPCSLGGPSLGMAVEVFDDAGNSVREAVGELVCTKPWPGMTRGLWRDRERYLETYWSRYPNVWWHGDFASVRDGQWYLHGRSDDTIKIAGKRLGPAEVESALVSHPAVVEAAAIGVPDELKGEKLKAFVVLATGTEPSEALRAELSDLVVTRLGRTFRPEKVSFTRSLPKTRSAKILRRAIRAIAIGDPLGDLSGLEDPAALDAIRQAT